MAIPEQLGFGKTGWHGDESVSLRSSLNSPSIQALLNDLRTQLNAALVKLDADAGVTDTDYVALLGVTGPSIAVTTASEHVALGSSYAHGDDAVRLRLSAGVSLLHEQKTNHNALLAKLDADVLVGATDFVNPARTVTSFSAAMSDFGAGGSATHGDAGVAVRRALEGRTALANELKAKHNLVMAKLDADAGVVANDFVATCSVTAPNLV